MQLEVSRIIHFTSNMAAMARFYRDVLGLVPLTDAPGWKEFGAGACAIALHRGPAPVRRRSPKVVFHSGDVAATRAALVARGARMGKIMSGDAIDFCDGRDPDGNAFSISSRPSLVATRRPARALRSPGRSPSSSRRSDR
ncbi:MAG: VOC family protein [Reyranellaceae bacterium]